MKTVLFIEDNADIRENMGEILELAGYNVLLAPDGKQGVTMAIAHTPHIIVCDIMMPELDGYGVIHMLQKNPGTQHIPFIFLTAKAERAELRKGMELGADDYITKPFSGTELLNAIEGRLKKAEGLKHVNYEKPAAIAQHKTIQQTFDEGQEVHEYQKKERIYSLDHQAFRLYLLKAGKVKLFKTNDDGKDLIIGICQAGDLFGYTALLEGISYHETAEALEHCEVASITKAAFEELMDNNPDVAQQFVRMLAGNVHEKEEKLLGIAYNSLRKKVAEALLLLHKKYRQDSDTAPTIHISRDNLAAMAGTAKESLIRTLSDFKAEGLLDIQSTDIIILQEKKLASLLS